MLGELRNFIILLLQTKIISYIHHKEINIIQARVVNLNQKTVWLGIQIHL